MVFSDFFIIQTYIKLEIMMNKSNIDVLKVQKIIRFSDFLSFHPSFLLMCCVILLTTFGGKGPHVMQ